MYDLIINTFRKYPRSVGVRYGGRSIQHGDNFIVEVSVLHWCYFIFN